jgi:hypothetical protein
LLQNEQSGTQSQSVAGRQPPLQQPAATPGNSPVGHGGGSVSHETVSWLQDVPRAAHAPAIQAVSVTPHSSHLFCGQFPPQLPGDPKAGLYATQVQQSPANWQSASVVQLSPSAGIMHVSPPVSPSPVEPSPSPVSVPPVVVSLELAVSSAAESEALVLDSPPDSPLSLEAVVSSFSVGPQPSINESAHRKRSETMRQATTTAYREEIRALDG